MRGSVTEMIYRIDQILPFVTQGRVTLDGESFKVGRFMIFRLKGTSCRGCGLRASFFKKEKSNDINILNLYGVGANDRQILFTRDHIIPVSRGGTADLRNMQPMCADCNNRKGDYISFNDRVKQTVLVFQKFFRRLIFSIQLSRNLLKSIWRK
jgi:hypothetical protein